MEQERYFVDKRVGCVAVRDRENMDDTPGLCSSTKGVTHYWSGVNGPDGWEVPECFMEAAKMTCEGMNRYSRR